MNRFLDKVNELDVKIGANGKLPQNVARPVSYEMTDEVLNTLRNVLGENVIGKSGNNEITILLPNESADNSNAGIPVKVTIKVPVNECDVYFDVQEYEDKLEKKRKDAADKVKAREAKIQRDKEIRELKAEQRAKLEEMKKVA